MFPCIRQSPCWALRTRLTFDNAVYVNQTGGYCWSTSQCRKLCFECAFAEGLNISRIQRRHSSHVAWKEDDQQYPPVFLLLGGLALWTHRADDHRVLLTSMPCGSVCSQQ